MPKDVKIFWSASSKGGWGKIDLPKIMYCFSSKNKRPVVIIFFCFFDSLSMHYMDFGVLLEFSYDSRKVFFEDIQYTTTQTQ